LALLPIPYLNNGAKLRGSLAPFVGLRDVGMVAFIQIYRTEISQVL